MDALAHPHWEAVVPKTREVLTTLGKLERVKPFYLAGGTALALRLGHRISQDLDLFANIENFDHAWRESIASALQQVYSANVLQDSPLGLVMDIEGLAVGLFTYGYPLLASTESLNGIELAGLLDIGLMKLDAIAGRGLRKDFYDVYFIAQHITLSDLLAHAREKYAYSRNFGMRVLTALVDFDIAETETNPPLLAPVTWEQVKAFCTAQAEDLGKQWFEE